MTHVDILLEPLDCSLIGLAAAVCCSALDLADGSSIAPLREKVKEHSAQLCILTLMESLRHILTNSEKKVLKRLEETGTMGVHGL